MKRATTFLSLLALSAGLLAQSSVKTERQYLSGRGCDDMVQWDFMCTGGNNSGKWTKIGVPSWWLLVVSEILPFVVLANRSKSTFYKILYHETKF